jgi:prepilin-type N-terminal cleavage/methylation domain-containing protein
MKYSFFSKRGFTLIEVLVVVAIIGILTAILVVNFSAARQNAKNKSLRSSLGQVQLGLEVYKAQNNQYPATLLALASYVSAIPTTADSGNPSCVITYATDAGGTYYKLTAANCVAGVTAQTNGVQTSDEFARCPATCGGSGVCNPASASFYESWAIYSAGGECL